jgi:hypothetical protein
MPATHWITEPPWRSSAAQAGSGQALLQLLERDVRRGHVNVAIRHFLMLDACAVDVPEDLREPCEAWLARCKAKTRAAIDDQVRSWSAMTRA